MTHCFTAALVVSLLERCPCSPSFIGLKKGKTKVTESQIICWVWQCSPAKVGYVLHSIHISMGGGVTMLQESIFLFLWLDSGILNLQCSRCCDITVRVDGSPEFWEIHKEKLLPTPKDSALHFTHWGLYLEHFLWWGIRATTSCAAVLTPCVITNNDVMMNLSLSYWFRRQIWIQYSLLLCEHSGNPLKCKLYDILTLSP